MTPRAQRWLLHFWAVLGTAFVFQLKACNDRNNQVLLESQNSNYTCEQPEEDF